MNIDLSAVDLWVWIVAGLVILALVGLLVWGLRRAAAKRRQREHTRHRLRERFGPEYDRTVERSSSRAQAEQDLLARERRRESFTVRPVPAAQRPDLRARWEQVQAGFVDAPHAALRRADELLDEVAGARGYPEAGREQRLADLSVDHPKAVERYRVAQPEGRRDGDGDHDTEQLRAALIAARDLFEVLLSEGEAGSAETPPTPFQDLVAEDERLEGERRDGPGANGDGRAGDRPREVGDTARSAVRTADQAPAFEPGDDRPREHVDTGGMPVLGPDGQPRAGR